MSDPHSVPARLACWQDGPPGAPVLVLGNSLGTTGAVWDRQRPVLREHFRLLGYEHRGHGSSPAPPGPCTIDDLGRDVLALLDAQGIGRFRYCGISLGGMIGLWLAARAPDRIAGLGLCCTAAFLPPAGFWADRAARVRSAGMARVAGQIAERWFTPAFRAAEPYTVRAFTASLTGIGPAGYASCCDAIAAMDLRPLLGEVRAPTLVLAGAEDAATPPWHGAVIAAGLPDARLAVIRGAAHLANVSAAGQVTAMLLSHLRTVA
jgi:3-oxoadipate enol-lactonase